MATTPAPAASASVSALARCARPGSRERANPVAGLSERARIPAALQMCER
jgi:hypothetical protein